MPNLQDKLYGEMKWDDEEFCWFSFVEVVPGDRIQVCVYAETPLDFLAVRNTHQTYNRLLDKTIELRQRAMREIIGNNTKISPKKRERQFMANMLEKELRLFSVMIYEDLSATVYFDAEIFEEDELVQVLIGANGEFLQASVSDGF